MAICALCKQESELQISHIMPKFVAKWLKKSSATGLLRQSANPHKPVQDSAKEKLLCNKCEIKFSKFETKFANVIFHPYQNNKNINFKITEEIVLFAISVAWRIAITAQRAFKKFPEEMLPHFNNAVAYWASILNKEELDTKYEHHIFFFDLGDESSEKSNMYMLRTIDMTIGAKSNEVFCFSKLPGMFIISLIYPSENKYCKNTKLKAGTTIKGPQTYVHDSLGGFLEHRVQVAFKHKLSQEQIDKITKRIERDINRAVKSESFRVRFNQ